MTLKPKSVSRNSNKINSILAKAIIFSAPSGSGKTTIVKFLLDKIPSLGFSVSACTRDKRESIEKSRKDYYFLTTEEFKKKIENGDFIEWEEVYSGIFYGTLNSEIERLWEEGKQVIFDVDVNGGVNLKEHFGNKALAVFVKPPSLEILEQRLSARKTETEDSMSQRILKAKSEMKFESKFDVTLVNDDLKGFLLQAEKLVIDFLNN